jgi:hypothetical protein
MKDDVLVLKFAEEVGKVFKAVTIHMDEIAAYNIGQFARMTNVDLG